MTTSKPHISVCICTFRRPELLERLLRDLLVQETEGLFTYSIVVADNDEMQSAEPVAAEMGASSQIPVTYCVQPRQNIALTRNVAVANSTGEWLAFIDDDEFPTKSWLATLYKTCLEYKVDGVLGPVKPYYNEGTPKWVIRGKFYDRPGYPTGFVIDGKKGRTGNVLLKRHLLTAYGPPFREEFRTGEDQDFFRRMIEKGHVFIWCSEAIAYEVVPPIRWNRSFMLRRALLRGATSIVHPSFGAVEIVKSLVALPLYAIALPFALLLGQHHFMNLLIKLCDHLGRMLALIGINPVRQSYVTE